MKLPQNNQKGPPGKKLGKYSSQFPLLVQRAKTWGFEIPTNQPRANVCVVWRLPPIHEHRIPGTEIDLMIPDEHDSPHVKGVLIAAGAAALSSLEGDGITLGHIVQWKRFAGEEMNDSTPEALKAMRIVWLQASDILASDDLMQALESGKADFKKNDGGRLQLEVEGDIPGAKRTKQISGRKAKLLALAAAPSATKHERETAAKLAANSK